jgi:hypothetical protein
VDEAMSRFTDLARPLPGELPGDTQRRAAREFLNAIAESHFDKWTPQVTSSADQVLVVGAAVWSIYDLRLLDLLADHVSRLEPQVHLVLFDIDRVSTPDELDCRVPGQEKPHHTPVVGHWSAGEFVESECGYAGRHLIYRLLGLDPAAADDFVLRGKTSSNV